MKSPKSKESAPTPPDDNSDFPGLGATRKHLKEVARKQAEKATRTLDAVVTGRLYRGDEGVEGFSEEEIDFAAEAAALASDVQEPKRWLKREGVADTVMTVVGDEDDDPEPDVVPRLLEGALLPPEMVRGTKQQALDIRRPQAPAVDPVTSYLSRYISRHSRLAMASSLKIVARYLTGQNLDPRLVPWPEIRYSHAQALRGRLAANYAWSSANRHLLALRGIMEECWRLGLVDREAYERICEVEALKATQQETGRALETAEIDRLLAACPDTPAGRRDAAVVALTAGGGMRRSEVCDARFENWDGPKFRLQVLGKGNKWRTVFISKKYHPTLEAWLAVRGDKPGSFVLPVSKHGTLVWGRALTSGGLYVLLQTLGRKAGVKDFTPHDLRRTYITRLLEKGADALTVSKLVGHSSVQTTMRYDKRDERAKAAVALLDD